MSLILSLSGTSSILNANFFPPIQLNGDYECALIDFHSYNSIPNIDKENNLFHIGDIEIEIPIGSYELADISNYIEKEYSRRKNGQNITVEANNNTLQIEVYSTHDSIYFNKERSIGRLFGFKKEILNAGIKHKSNLPVNILRVNVIRIQCSITTGSYMNNSPAHTLHEFSTNVSPGYKLDEIPRNLIYLPVNTKEISSLQVWIVDQEERIINFRGEEITLRLHLRPTS